MWRGSLMLRVGGPARKHPNIAVTVFPFLCVAENGAEIREPKPNIASLMRCAINNYHDSQISQGPRAE
jgi:hypothetical protein